MSHSQWDVMKKTQMYFSKHTLQICASGDTITSPRRGSGAPQPPAVSLSLPFLQQISHCGFKRGGWKRPPRVPSTAGRLQKLGTGVLWGYIWLVCSLFHPELQVPLSLPLSDNACPGYPACPLAFSSSVSYIPSPSRINLERKLIPLSIP